MLAAPLVWTPTGWQWLPVLLVALAAYEALRQLVVRLARRRIEAQVDRFLHAHRIPTDPFRYTHRLAVREQVMADPGLAAAIAKRAAEEAVPVPDVQRRVRAWLDEIVPQFNLLAYYRIGYALARMATYSVYHVRLDRDSLRRAQTAIPPDAAVVYVSNHRSNADFVVTGFMLSRSVQVSYAVGEWARVWPLEGLFRSFGSYFVRRGETDPLYHRTLDAYVQLITRQSVTQAMFPEGGLTRDGLLRPPKLGLLDSMVRTKQDPGFTQPLVFVPVGINFDRVLEDEAMVHEWRDEEPYRRRTVAQKLARLGSLARRGLIGIPVNAARFFTKRLKKHGIAAIHFGTPLVFDDWYAANGGGALDEPDRHARREALRPFAEELMHRVGRCIPVTPVPLVCLALSAIGREQATTGIPRAALRSALQATVDQLRTAGAPFFAEDPYDDQEVQPEGPQDAALGDVDRRLEDAAELQQILRMALDVTAKRGILRRHGDGYRTLPECWDLVEYYANSIRCHLETLPEASQTPTPA